MMQGNVMGKLGDSSMGDDDSDERVASDPDP